jgi:transcriptional regulator with XRE-family HTH domain
MAQSIGKAFGVAVRTRREQQGVSQEELAARAGIHRTYVSSIELGKVRVGLEIAAKVAAGLGLPLSELIAEAEGKEARRRARHKGK